MRRQRSSGVDSCLSQWLPAHWQYQTYPKGIDLGNKQMIWRIENWLCTKNCLGPSEAWQHISAHQNPQQRELQQILHRGWWGKRNFTNQPVFVVNLNIINLLLSKIRFLYKHQFSEIQIGNHDPFEWNQWEIYVPMNWELKTIPKTICPILEENTTGLLLLRLQAWRGWVDPSNQNRTSIVSSWKGTVSIWKWWMENHTW